MGPSFDICVIELWALLLELLLINRAPPNLLREHDVLYLFVDNKPVVLWVAGKAQMQHTYVRDTLIRVYAQMERLRARTGITCTIQWCRRGQWMGNNRADEQAKAAVLRTDETPPVGYLPTAHGAIKTEIKRQVRLRRNVEYEREAAAGEHMLSRLFFSWQLSTEPAFRPKDDHRMLTRNQIRIVNMLRSGHSSLNFSKHVSLHREYYSREWKRCNHDISRLQMMTCTQDCCSTLSDGLCAGCKVPEDEEHFLLICPDHAALRRRTIDVWRRVYALLQEQFSLKSLLFPPVSFEWRHRKMILQAVVRFAIQSGKFKRL